MYQCAELNGDGNGREEEDRWAPRREASTAQEAGRSRGAGAHRQQAPYDGSGGQECGGPRASRDGGGQAGGYGREPNQAPASRNGASYPPLDDDFPGLSVGGQVRPAWDGQCRLHGSVDTKPLTICLLSISPTLLIGLCRVAHCCNLGVMVVSLSHRFAI